MAFDGFKIEYVHAVILYVQSMYDIYIYTFIMYIYIYISILHNIIQYDIIIHIQYIHHIYICILYIYIYIYTHIIYTYLLQYGQHPTLQVTMPQRPAPPQPSHAVLVDRGLGGSFTLRWAPHDDGAKEDAKALDYEVFWTVPGEEAEATRLGGWMMDG